MKTFQITKVSSGQRRYIRVAEPIWDDGIKVSEKVGMIEIDPEDETKALANLEKFKSGELVATLGSVQNRLNSFYDVTVTKKGVVAEVAGTLETKPA